MLSYPTQPGDLDHLIADDHAVIFRLLEAGSVNRRVLVDQVAAAVAMHIDIAESVLGPALADAGRRDEADKLHLEHVEVRNHLIVLARDGPGEAAFEEAVSAVVGVLRGHAEVEEEMLLPDLPFEVGPEKMGVLGRGYLEAKRRALSSSPSRSPGSDCRATGAVRHAVTVDLSCDAPLELVEPPMVAARPNTPARDAWYVNAHAYGDAGPPVGVP